MPRHKMYGRSARLAKAADVTASDIALSMSTDVKKVRTKLNELADELNEISEENGDDPNAKTIERACDAAVSHINRAIGELKLLV